MWSFVGRIVIMTMLCDRTERETIMLYKDRY